MVKRCMKGVPGVMTLLSITSLSSIELSLIPLWAYSFLIFSSVSLFDQPPHEMKKKKRSSKVSLHWNTCCSHFRFDLFVFFVFRNVAWLQKVAEYVSLKTGSSKQRLTPAVGTLAMGAARNSEHERRHKSGEGPEFL